MARGIYITRRTTGVRGRGQVRWHVRRAGEPEIGYNLSKEAAIERAKKAAEPGEDIAIIGESGPYRRIAGSGSDLPGADPLLSGNLEDLL